MNTIRTYPCPPRRNSSQCVLLVAGRPILVATIICLCARITVAEENDQPGDLIASFNDSPMTADWQESADSVFGPAEQPEVFPESLVLLSAESVEPIPATDESDESTQLIAVPGEIAVAGHRVISPIPNLLTDACGESVDCGEASSSGSIRRFHSFRKLMKQPYRSYRSGSDSISIVPGSNSDLGFFSAQTGPYLAQDEDDGVVAAINVHWLAGPTTVRLRPRLYDAIVGYQLREQVSNEFSYDLYASAGLFTDFEDSARDGGRYRSHAVGIYHADSSLDVVFGVDFQDRDLVQVLPVFGLSIRDVWNDKLRMDLVFPRPRIDYQLNDKRRVYLAGETTGGRWDTENLPGGNHIISYSDDRILVGFEHMDDDGDITALEMGYAFDRRIKVRGIAGEFLFDDAFVVRFVHRH